MTINEVVDQLKLDWDDHEKVNKKLHSLFALYHKNQKFPYREVLDKIQELYPEETKKHFRYRMDNRSLGEFGMDIYKGHLLERRIAERWMDIYASEHFGEVTSECVGIDDRGCLLLETGQSKDEMKRPDYLLQPNNILIEIKSNVCDWKFTPKVADLKHYLKNNAHVLAVCSSGGPLSEDGSNWSCYFVISPEQIKKMLDEGTVVKRREVGSKPAIQFHWNLTTSAVKNKRQHYDRLDYTSLPLEDFCEIHRL